MRTDIFGAEADAVIAAAFRWLENKRAEVLPPIVPAILGSNRQPCAFRKPAEHGLMIAERHYDLLRIMAANSGWLEVGGRAMREYSDHQTGGDVIGRTPWIGRPEWAQGCDMTTAEIWTAVEKAISGEKLGTKQQAIVEAMLEQIADNQDFSDQEPGEDPIPS